MQNIGKGRAFLIVGLNKGLLCKSLRSLVKNALITEQYYEPHAIVLSEKDTQYFLAQLDVLMTMEFNVNLNEVWDVNSDDLINEQKASILAKQTRNSENHRKRVEDEKSRKPVRSILRKFSNGGSKKVKDIGHKLMKLNLFGNKPIPSKQGFRSTK